MWGFGVNSSFHLIVMHSPPGTHLVCTKVGKTLVPSGKDPLHIVSMLRAWNKREAKTHHEDQAARMTCLIADFLQAFAGLKQLQN